MRSGLGGQKLPEAVSFRIPASPHPLISANHPNRFPTSSQFTVFHQAFR